MKLVMNKSLKEILGSWIVSLSLMIGSMAVALADNPALPAGSGQAPATPGGMAQQPGGIMAFLPFVMMFAVLYFLILRPQQKKLKEQQEMLSSLKQGDEIITASGIIGKVTGITDKVVTVEVADNVRVKMMKSQVSQKGSVKDLTQ